MSKLPETEAPPRRSARRAAREARRGVVLVVDDEPGIRDLSAFTLESAGFEVLAAADGEEALLIVERADPRVDAVILDVNLPGALRGEETFARLLDAQPGLLVALMSGAPIDECLPPRLLVRQAGYLQKPFSSRDLVDMARLMVPPPHRRKRGH